MADDPPAVMPFGFSLYGMKSLTSAEALKTCAAIGYDAVELALLPGWPCDPARLSADSRRDLRKQLADLGLRLPAVMENLSLLAPAAEHAKNLDRLKAAAALAHELSPESPPVIETILGGAPVQWENLKDRMAERLLEWANVAAASKITVAVKPHVRGALHTPEGALWLLGQVNRPEIRLVYDYSHFQLRKIDLAKSIESLAAKSAFAHIKDARGSDEKFEFLLPGETGTVDYSELLRLLSNNGYRGSVMVEVSGMISGRPDYDPVQAAKASYAAIAPAFEKAGLRRK